MTNAKGHLDTFLDGLGVRLLPVWRRRKGAQSHARATMYEVMREHGEGHLALVIRFIRDSEGNREALWSETIGAVSDVLAHRPDWADRASDLFAAFDSLDLNAMRLEAVRCRPWPVRATLRTDIYRVLQQRLDGRVDRDLFGASAA